MENALDRVASVYGAGVAVFHGGGDPWPAVARTIAGLASVAGRGVLAPSADGGRPVAHPRRGIAGPAIVALIGRRAGSQLGAHANTCPAAVGAGADAVVIARSTVGDRRVDGDARRVAFVSRARVPVVGRRDWQAGEPILP